MDNRALIASIFDRMARGEVRALGDALGDDSRWVFPGVWSWAGAWEGRDAVLNGLLRPLMRQFADYRSEAQLILADGDRVAVQAHATATTVRGDAYPQTYLFVFRVRDGRITEVVEHCDTALVERVLEPVEPRAARR